MKSQIKCQPRLADLGAAAEKEGADAWKEVIDYRYDVSKILICQLVERIDDQRFISYLHNVFVLSKNKLLFSYGK